MLSLQVELLSWKSEKDISGDGAQSHSPPHAGTAAGIAVYAQPDHKQWPPCRIAGQAWHAPFQLDMLSKSDVAYFAGGVLKTVVKEGEGWQHPKGKDEVMGAPLCSTTRQQGHKWEKKTIRTGWELTDTWL